jgi:hypothetical protein
MIDVAISLPSPESLYTGVTICFLGFVAIWLFVLSAISLESRDYPLFITCIFLIMVIFTLVFYVAFCTPKVGMQMFNLTITQVGTKWGGTI